MSDLVFGVSDVDVVSSMLMTEVGRVRNSPDGKNPDGTLKGLAVLREIAAERIAPVVGRDITGTQVLNTLNTIRVQQMQAAPRTPRKSKGKRMSTVVPKNGSKTSESKSVVRVDKLAIDPFQFPEVMDEILKRTTKMSVGDVFSFEFATVEDSIAAFTILPSAQFLTRRYEKVLLVKKVA